MAILSAQYLNAAGSLVTVREDGSEWSSPWSLDPAAPIRRDTEQRAALAEWEAAGGVIAPYAAPAAEVPEEISDRQFAHGLWKQGVITLDEAKAFVRVGTLPAALSALVAAMPAEQRDDADLMIAGSTIFHRSHPFTVALSAAFGWSAAQTDDFWRFAATL